MSPPNQQKQDNTQMKKTTSTKDLLISSAGELFADNGYEGVSTRMIADMAGVKLSAIHYHFGSKEKLYTEACLSAHRRSQSTIFADVIAENPVLAQTSEGQAEIIRTTVFRTFHYHFRPDRPEWEAKILLRELASPTSAMTTLIEILFRPNSESSANFYRHINPEATEAEAAAWSDLLYGQILLYSMAKNTIKMLRGEDSLNTEFFHTAATKLARSMILEAGLPLPNDLHHDLQ